VTGPILSLSLSVRQVASGCYFEAGNRRVASAMEIAPDSAFISSLDRTIGETSMPPPRLVSPEGGERCNAGTADGIFDLPSCSNRKTLENWSHRRGSGVGLASI
jgi:hypothetical protein